MIVEQSTIGLMEEFKIPYRDPFCPEDWKDWYHYILYDPKSHVRILYNVCFNGRPGTGFVADTLFVTTPKGFIDQPVVDFSEETTYGFSRNQQWKEGDLETTPFNYQGEEISFRISDSNVMGMHVTNKDQGFEFYLSGKSVSSPVYVPELAPYGRGFMGWGVMAGYQISGQIRVQNRLMTITEDWYCYHDRNFGRFNWGNIGWTWFVANAWDGDTKWAYVLHRSNDSNFSDFGSPILFLYCNDKLVKIFFGETIDIQIDWTDLPENPPILPGSMASVFNDRAVRMPTKITVDAYDERHLTKISMDVSTRTEMIIPSSMKKEYTFLKELSGDVVVEQNVGEEYSQTTSGFFYAEVVH